MDHKLLTYLPTEILMTILCKLPLQAIISCKCVCKSLLHLLETPDFIKFHLSKSIPGLIVCDEKKVVWYSFEKFELKDELDLEKHELRYVPVTEFGYRAFITPFFEMICIEGSANGLLLLANGVDFTRNVYAPQGSLYICNPITREYISLPNLEDFYSPGITAHGFGVTKRNGQYKVVKIFQECELDEETARPVSVSRIECRVYTLGSGSWSRVPPDSNHLYNSPSNGALLNGNLHWLVTDLKESLLISRFDLETERFDQAFSTPRSLPESRIFAGDVAVLEDCICLCDNTSDNEIVVWIMKEYGVEESWTKEFVISKLPEYVLGNFMYDVVYPIKVFRDGDILILCRDFHLYYYSNKTKTTPNVNELDLQVSNYPEARLHVSSFLSLKTFEMENVAKF